MLERGRFFLSPEIMFKHNGDGPKLLRSHAVNATQHIWNGVTIDWPIKTVHAMFE